LWHDCSKQSGIREARRGNFGTWLQNCNRHPETAKTRQNLRLCLRLAMA
jgi:hypothetical protein